jgi:hypothetical protein
MKRLLCCLVLLFASIMCVSAIMDYGYDAAEKEYPFAVYIEINDDINMHCTGVVVGEYWVLSNANCIAQAGGDPSVVKVYGGGIANVKIARQGPAVQKRNVLGLYYHPEWYAGVFVEDEQRHTFYDSFIPNHNWALLGLETPLTVEPLGIMANVPKPQTPGFMDTSMGFGYGYQADFSDYSYEPSQYLRIMPSGSIYTAEDCSQWANVDGNFHFCYNNAGGNPCWGDGIIITKFMDKWWVFGVLNQYNPSSGYDSFSQTYKYTFCGSDTFNVYTRLDIDLEYMIGVMNGEFPNAVEPQGSGPEPQGSGPEPQGSGPEPQGPGPEPQGSGPEPQGPGPEPQGSNPEPAPEPQGGGPEPAQGPDGPDGPEN